MTEQVIEKSGTKFVRIATKQSTATEDKTPKDVIVERGLTVYLGGAGMNGGYISSQVQALKKVGIHSAVSGRLSEGQYIDAAGGVTKHRYRLKRINGISNTGPYSIEADWSLSAMGISRNPPPTGQFNLVGYSFGSLVAAQSALYYADKGQKIDHLVLIGAPISQEMLSETKSHPLIKDVIVIDLKEHGDPIYAGMPLSSLVGDVPDLVYQMAESEKRQQGTGHFYYGIDGPSGDERRLSLARSLYEKGLR
ncbi:alpha/beta fold hydrolase [Pseudomonas benzenivorans]|uniref:alpha/beta fold hydrolase n=1 Tax=Pseudomonas benzenivorans TaxID=556533 RepID=UPI0035132637